MRRTRAKRTYDVQAVVERVARYDGLKPKSVNASKAAKGSSRKSDTKPELTLRDALRAIELRGYRLNSDTLPGKPDVVFSKAKVVVFCDGDFWHGRDLEDRLAKLADGHNPQYWVEKIRGNVARDRRHDETLASDGWLVLRFWESRIRKEPSAVAEEIRASVAHQLEEHAATQRVGKRSRK